jgi:hypothetical protein
VCGIYKILKYSAAVNRTISDRMVKHRYIAAALTWLTRQRVSFKPSLGVVIPVQCRMALTPESRLIRQICQFAWIPLSPPCGGATE